MTTTYTQKLILLWTLMVVCMMLHFDYNVSGIFYGIDVTSKDAKGVPPPTLLTLRLLFHLLPMLFAVLLLFFAGKSFRWLMVIVSPLYVLAHAFHLFGILGEKPFDTSQAILLSFMVAISVLQSGVAYRWARQLS